MWYTNIPGRHRWGRRHVQVKSCAGAVEYCKARTNVRTRSVEAVVRRGSGGVDAHGAEGSNLLPDAVTLDVVLLVFVGVFFGIDVARGPAPFWVVAFEASVVGPVE